eukprot:363267-Chlamydomonas_euryale.AAC.19
MSRPDSGGEGMGPWRQTSAELPSLPSTAEAGRLQVRSMHYQTHELVNLNAHGRVQLHDSGLAGVFCVVHVWQSGQEGYSSVGVFPAAVRACIHVWHFTPEFAGKHVLHFKARQPFHTPISCMHARINQNLHACMHA